MWKCSHCGYSGAFWHSVKAGDEYADKCPECGSLNTMEAVVKENETLRVLEAWARGTSTGMEHAFKIGTLGEKEYAGATMVLELLHKFIIEERKWDDARSR